MASSTRSVTTSSGACRTREAERLIYTIMDQCKQQRNPAYEGCDLSRKKKCRRKVAEVFLLSRALKADLEHIEMRPLYLGLQKVGTLLNS